VGSLGRDLPLGGRHSNNSLEGATGQSSEPGEVGVGTVADHGWSFIAAALNTLDKSAIVRRVLITVMVSQPQVHRLEDSTTKFIWLVP